jgi:hypothetical protein
MTDMNDADLKGVVLIDAVLMGAVRHFGEASKGGAAGAKASAEGPMEGPGGVANKAIGSSDHRVIGRSKFKSF